MGFSMKPLNSQIAGLEQAIAALDEGITAIKEKEDKYRSRRQKLEQRRKKLEQKLAAELDTLYLTQQKDRLASDPEELKRFLAGMGQRLKTERQRAHFKLPPKDAGSAKPDSTDMANIPAGATPQSPESNVQGDAAPAKDAGSAEPDFTVPTEGPASAEPQPPESNDKSAAVSAAPQSPESSVEEEDPPATQQSPTNTATDELAAPAKAPAPLASDKQRRYLKDLIRKNPAAAKKLKIDSVSLDRLSQAEASRAIKRLSEPSPSGSRRAGTDADDAKGHAADVA